jgi:hypothetical protein
MVQRVGSLLLYADQRAASVQAAPHTRQPASPGTHRRRLPPLLVRSTLPRVQHLLLPEPGQDGSRRRGSSGQLLLLVRSLLLHHQQRLQRPAQQRATVVLPRYCQRRSLGPARCNSSPPSGYGCGADVAGRQSVRCCRLASLVATVLQEGTMPGL